MSVLVADIDQEAGDETVERIEDDGGTATFVAVDVSDPTAVEAMVERAVEEYGRLDLAVNNVAAGADPAPVTDILEADWDRVTDISQKGV